MLHDLPHLGDAVHPGHVDIVEDALVAGLTARLGHVFVVHVNSHEAICGLVALSSELVLNDCLERHQVEYDVVDEQNLSHATTPLLLVTVPRCVTFFIVLVGGLFLEHRCTILALFLYQRFLNDCVALLDDKGSRKSLRLLLLRLFLDTSFPLVLDSFDLDRHILA